MSRLDGLLFIRACSDEIEGTPGEHASHRIEVGGVDVTANAGGLKRDRTPAREGIGDRNIMAEEDTEESEIQSPLGRMYLIYRPKGRTARKIEIDSNWQSDANMLAEKHKDQLAHPVLGRYHGFSASGISLAEFTKIIQSLHPIGTSGRSIQSK